MSHDVSTAKRSQSGGRPRRRTCSRSIVVRSIDEATRMSWLRLLGAALLLGILAVASPTARESSGTPAARAFFAEGEAEAKAGKYAGAAAAFRKAIEADPDFVEAHQRFIESTQRRRAERPRFRGSSNCTSAGPSSTRSVRRTSGRLVSSRTSRIRPMSSSRRRWQSIQGSRERMSCSRRTPTSAVTGRRSAST